MRAVLFVCLTLGLALGLLSPAAAVDDKSKSEGASCSATTSCVQRCSDDNFLPCQEACASKLSTKARPYYEALRTCSKKSCMDACQSSPTGTRCKLCVMGSCASEVSSCITN